ncbi:hypothetical protein DFP72DRAFT_863256 [Ephemerocybe angulata]|uniref:Uncharacterized protein n=1 Tax=Ephemerocybe angulata TaxID=980116 RepID=A0A8H6H5W2_9AGAR|nr:hypothetical protein DFP72DRAFT_863256 [Tulosesus angulatus]
MVRDNDDSRAGGFSGNIGGIIGVTIGGVVALILLVLFLFFGCRRYRRRVTPNSSVESILPSQSGLRRLGSPQAMAGQGDSGSDNSNASRNILAAATSLVGAVFGRKRNTGTSSGSNSNNASNEGLTSKEKNTLSRDVSKRSGKSEATTLADGGVMKGMEQQMEEGLSMSMCPPSYGYASMAGVGVMLSPKAAVAVRAGGNSDESLTSGGKSGSVSSSTHDVHDGLDGSVTVRKRVSLPGPRPKPGSTYRSSRRHSSTPHIASREDAEPALTEEAGDGWVTEFGEVSNLQEETRAGSAGNLRGLWHRLSSGGPSDRRRSAQTATTAHVNSKSTLSINKATSSTSDVGYIHNPFGSVESLADVLSPAIAPTHSTTSPSSLLNPPPAALTAPPSGATLSSLASSSGAMGSSAPIPVLTFPRSVTGNSYTGPSSASSPAGTMSGMPVGTTLGPFDRPSGQQPIHPMQIQQDPQRPWPTFTLPPAPSPALTTRTLSDDGASVVRAEGLLHPGLLGPTGGLGLGVSGLGVGSIQGGRSMASLRDHFDYSRPLGSGLANAIAVSAAPSQDGRASEVGEGARKSSGGSGSSEEPVGAGAVP